MKRKRVFVSGCFDMLHSGHFRFLEEAAAYGDLYVAIGSDQTICGLKGRAPVNTQAERQYMLQAVRHVKECFISTGSGVLDFLAEMSNPDVRKAIRHYQKIAAGWKLSGAGGGGYLVLVAEQPIPDAIQLKIRRPGH